MATLTSSYQFLGRSDVMKSTSGSLSYYLLLYGKTVADENTGIHKVTIKSILASTTSGATYYYYTQAHNGKIDGGTAFSGTNKPKEAWELSNFKADGVTYKTGTLLGEGSVSVDCTDGLEKDVTLSCYYLFNDTADSYTPAKGTSRTVSVTATLPAILRATTPTLDFEEIDLGETITINTPRVKDTFTHDLYYQVGTSAKTKFAEGVETSFDWSDNLFLINWINNSEEGTVTIYCETYNGDTFIGEKSVTFTGKVPSDIVPTIDTFEVSEYIEEVATKIGEYVKGKSRLKINASASGDYGSTITSYKIVANGETFNTSEAITSLLTSSGVNSISVSVTDSRNRTNSETLDIEVLDYFLPKAGGLSVYRCNSDGTLNDEGVYVKAYVNYEIAPLEDKNLKRVLIQYLNGETWTTLLTLTDSYVGKSEVYVITNTEFNVDNTYEFRLVVEDYFSIDEWNALPLLPSYTLMNYHASGKAIGFGKVATREEGFQFGDFIYDQWDTVITNGLAVYGGDPDTTLESLIMTSTNSPNGEAMFFHTFFSSNKSDTQNCGQIAVPYYYNGTQSMYWRYRFGGEWSEWFEIANKSQVDNLSKKVEDTYWINAELESDFKLYNSSSYCRYRKIGKQVNIQFVLSPSSSDNVLNSATETTAFVLPEEFRPSQNLNVLCQGSSTNIFNVGVNTSGNVNIYRYRNSASYSSSPPSTTAWLPCNITYFVD